MSQRTLRASTRKISKRPESSIEAKTITEPSKKRQKTKSSPLAKVNDVFDDGVAQSSQNHIVITESTGDIFATTKSDVLLHACNCQGSWGAGIAAAFRTRYPSAFTAYQAHCSTHGAGLLGTCFFIPPQLESDSESERNAAIWIGCLFTSVGKGKGKGSVRSILDATGSSMKDLLEQLRRLKTREDESESSNDEHAWASVKMCKINSGLFRVPWERTKAVIEGIEIADEEKFDFQVVSPDGQSKG